MVSLTYPVYKIDFSNAKAIEEYKISKCNEEISTSSESVGITCDLVAKDGVEKKASGEGYIEISVAPGINDVTIIAKTDNGEEKTITLQILNQSC